MAKRSKPRKASTQIETPEIIGDNEAPIREQTEPATAPDAEWFGERIAECHLQKQEVAARLGMHPNLLLKLLTGERRCQIGEAIALARMLRVPKGELMRRLGFEWPRDMIRVTGKVDGDCYVSELPAPEQFTVECPFEYETNLAALTVEATHTALGVYSGMIVYYSPSPGVSVEAFGRLAVIGASELKAGVLGHIDRSSHGKGTISLFGGIGKLSVQTIVSASPVRWLRAG